MNAMEAVNAAYDWLDENSIYDQSTRTLFTRIFAAGVEAEKAHVEAAAKGKEEKITRWGSTCEMGYTDCEMRGYCNGDC
jgi:hypothetical protein